MFYKPMFYKPTFLLIGPSPIIFFGSLLQLSSPFVTRCSLCPGLVPEVLHYQGT